MSPQAKRPAPKGKTPANSLAKSGPSPIWWIVGVGVAVVGVALVVGVSSSKDSTTNTSHLGRSDAPDALVEQVVSVPAATLDAVGAGSATAPTKITEGAASGPPTVLFVGAEFCPYCAAERWSLVNALGRFGTFSGLKTTYSSSTDVFPDTPTFSFYGSNYSSDVVSFEPVEIATNEPDGSRYKKLETPTADQEKIWLQYAPQGGVPFLHIADKYVITSPSYAVDVLKGLNFDQIASAMQDPNSAVAKAAVGAANLITAAICASTNDQPASACTASIKALEANLAK